MTLKTASATIALLLAACNGGTGSSNGTAAANAPAPAIDNRMEDVTPPPAPPLPDLEGARVLIGRIYMPYTSGRTPDLRNVYTPELQRAIDRQDDGDGTGLGYDPFCRCQDFENFRYTIQSVERRTPTGAAARISIYNMNEHRIVTLWLDYRNDRWLVADIREGQESLLAAGRR